MSSKNASNININDRCRGLVVGNPVVVQEFVGIHRLDNISKNGNFRTNNLPNLPKVCFLSFETAPNL